jgi:hypothetical protein
MGIRPTAGRLRLGRDAPVRIPGRLSLIPGAAVAAPRQHRRSQAARAKSAASLAGENVGARDEAETGV